MIKIFGKKIKKERLAEFLLSLAILLLSLSIFLIRKNREDVFMETVLFNKSNVSDDTVKNDYKAKIYFEPAENKISGGSPVRIMANALDRKIAFARVVFSFDPSEVQLGSEINTNGNFSTIVEKTPISEANSTGKIVLVIASSPDDQKPEGVFEIANMEFLPSDIRSSESQILNFDVADMQMVDSDAINLPIVQSDGVLILD